MFIKNLVIEQVNIENPEMDMAFLVLNTKKVIQKGITTPPPPMPAIVHKAINIGSTMIPANSKG